MKKKNNSVYGGLHLTATCHFEYDVLNSRCGVCLLAMLSLCLTAWLLFFTLIYSRYPDAIDDLLINQEISVVKTKPLNFAKNSVSGRREMSGVNVTFMGVGKNIEKHADSFLQQVEELSSMFYGSQAIFVVGTSNDDSAAKLKKWAKKSDHNRTILELDDEHLVDTVGKFLGLPLPREGRIAAARNTALNYYRQQQAHLTDYIINIDMDVIGWNLNGVQDSFGKKSQWDAVCANGVLLHGIYRDVYALRFPGMNTNHHLAGNDHEIYDIDSSQKDRNRNNLRRSREKAHDLMDNTVQNTPAGVDYELIPAESCFGGMAIYKSAAIGNCTYEHRYPDPPFMLDCEHVLFHQCMAKHSGGVTRIVSNPNMKLWYGHSDLQSLDVKKLWSSLVPR